MVTRSQTKALQAQLNKQLHAGSTVNQPESQLFESPVNNNMELEELTDDPTLVNEVQDFADEFIQQNLLQPAETLLLPKESQPLPSQHSHQEQSSSTTVSDVPSSSAQPQLQCKVEKTSPFN